MTAGERTAIDVIDTHTAGEPTRVIVGGGPPLGDGCLADRAQRFKRDFDSYRSAVVNEPRGHEAMVGALLVPPDQPNATTGVIFFNNVGFLGMCGHGTLGVIAALGHSGRIGAGPHLLDTPVGQVTAFLHDNGDVSLENVASKRHVHGVAIDVPGIGPLKGDIAWGGNWFFLVEQSQHRQLIEMSQIRHLTAFATEVRRALEEHCVTGSDGAEIDHVELFGPPSGRHADSRNFVLCPGGAYDRSPCGTGTSAKLACLYQDGVLAAGQTWRQESIIGAVFEGSVRVADGYVIPTIRGRAHVVAEARLLLDKSDPLMWGIPTGGIR